MNLMSNTFLELYQHSSNKNQTFAGIIGTYQGLINIIISELESQNPLYSKDELVYKIKLENEILKQKLKEANT